MPKQQVVDVNKSNWYRPAIQPRRVIENPPQAPQLVTNIKREPHDPEDSQVVSVGGTRNGTPIETAERVPAQAVAAESATTSAPIPSQIVHYGHQVPTTKAQDGVAQKSASGIRQNAPTVATPTVTTAPTLPTPFIPNSNGSHLGSQFAPTAFFQAMRAPDSNPQFAPGRDLMYAFPTAQHPKYLHFSMVPQSSSRRPGPPPTNTTFSMSCPTSTPRAPQTTQTPNLNMQNSGPRTSQSLATRAPPQQMPTFDPSIMPHQFQAALYSAYNAHLPHTPIPHFQNIAAHGNQTSFQPAPTNKNVAQPTGSEQIPAFVPNAYLQQQLQQLQQKQLQNVPMVEILKNISAHGNQTGFQSVPSNQIQPKAQPPGSHQMSDSAPSGQKKPNTNNGKEEMDVIFNKLIKEASESATQVVNHQQSEIKKKDEEIERLKRGLEFEKSQSKKYIESAVTYQARYEALENRMKLQEEELEATKRMNVEKDKNIKDLSEIVRAMQVEIRTQKDEYEGKIVEFEMSADGNTRKLAAKETEVTNLKNSLKVSKEETTMERSKTQALSEKLNVETSARKSDWSMWNAARAEEMKNIEEAHQMKMEQLKSDQNVQVADLQGQIQERDDKMKMMDEKNEKERKEWKEARGEEIKQMKEMHQKEKNKLISDHNGNLKRQIEEKDVEMKKEIEEMKEKHQKETETLMADHKNQVDELQRKIQEKDGMMQKEIEKNERERAEQDRKNLLAQKTMKEAYEKKIQEKTRMLDRCGSTLSENMSMFQKLMENQKRVQEELEKQNDEKCESLGSKECNVLPKQVEKDQPNKDEEHVSEPQIAEEEGQRGATGPQKRHLKSSEQKRQAKMKKIE